MTDADAGANHHIGEILVVDDNASNIFAIESALDGFNVRVVAARSGADALRTLLEHDFALILLDVQMPGMNGFETARLVRAHRRCRGTPIIFVTAHDRSDRAVLQAYELGAVDFLFKPVEPVVLRAKVAVFADLARRTAEVAEQQTLLRDHERRAHEQILAQERLKWKEEALRLQMEEERRSAEKLALRAEELARTVAERERVEHELTRTNRQLAEADRRKDEFLAVLAHELRNPLAPLASGLELWRAYLDKHRVDDPVILRTREVMSRQVHHMTRLIDDLLDVSRITTGKIELHRHNVDLAEVVQGAIHVSEPAIQERSQRLSVLAPDERVVVRGDPVRLTQVLANLLNNASRYTEAGGEIRVRWGLEDGQATISVEDTGEGMDPDFAGRVFDMFVQKTPGRGGLGIGLTLVRRLVELHGGTVHATSKGPRHGSAFTIGLPLASGSVADRTSAPYEPAQGAGLHVIVVDDNADVRMTMRDLLESWGHAVEVGADGEEGLALIVRERPDVAIVDLGLPELDGFGVAAGVREQLRDAPLRLVAMSGFSAAESRQRAFDVGFDDYLIKPANMKNLREILDAARPMR